MVTKRKVLYQEEGPAESTVWVKSRTLLDMLVGKGEAMHVGQHIYKTERGRVDSQYYHMYGLTVKFETIETTTKLIEVLFYAVGEENKFSKIEEVVSDWEKWVSDFEKQRNDNSK